DPGRRNHQARFGENGIIGPVPAYVGVWHGNAAIGSKNVKNRTLHASILEVSMNESYITGWIASALQFMVAGYALRLNRRFGTARVGWSLFCAFSLLALLQLVQSTSSFDVVVNAALKINVTYALISFLLLIGMLHLETMLKERSRMERVEKQLRAELEL